VVVAVVVVWQTKVMSQALLVVLVVVVLAQEQTVQMLGLRVLLEQQILAAVEVVVETMVLLV
jgi:hypothetical protein